jgi:hypothetical protein
LRRAAWIWGLAALAALLLTWGGTAAGASDDGDLRADLSGAAEFRDVDFGTDVTECPQAGLRHRGDGDDGDNGSGGGPKRRMARDAVERLSDRGNDIRMNQDYSCFPQNEMSIAVNPRDGSNVVGGANDYRLGFGTSGFYSSTNGGRSWYDGIIPYPSIPTQPQHGPLATGEMQDGGGDPAVIFDRTGVVFWTDINFNRDDDTNGIYTARSTNGGWTWSRPCVGVNPAPGSTESSTCFLPTGDARQPGDGVVTHNQDNNLVADGSVDFDDKEYNDTGPRPAGVQPTCFTPTTRTPIPVGTGACTPSRISPDRLYVTWTRFNAAGTAGFIMASYSDDRGRSWSAPKLVSTSAPFCNFGLTGGNNCDDNQGSQPVVHPATGIVYVAYENFNTEDENQYLLSISRDGGNTWEAPRFITVVFDTNFPTSGANRPDGQARGQGGGRRVLTNSCYRVNARGALVVDKRSGAYADDLYLVIADNRNGTRPSTNTDVLLFKSVNGGNTWVGPTRVNDDPSVEPANRDCGRNPSGPEPLQPPCPPNVNTGNDQIFPWLDMGPKGDIQVVWQDRRLDRDSVDHEWPTSRQRPGNYLHWFWGAHCEVDRADSRECVAPTAQTITPPTGIFNPPATTTFPVQTVFPFRNFGISDHPYNWDYCFRAGIFCGDYENVFIDQRNTARAMWTDSRNGRSSRNQPGRNPICEQSDTFMESYRASGRASGQNEPRSTDRLFLVTPCPADHGPGDGDDEFDDD